MTDTLDTRGAAELLHVSHSKVQEMARLGEIPAVEIGKGYVFIRADLLDWLHTQAVDQQRERQQKAQIAAELAAIHPAPKRGRGRPPKLKISGQNSGHPL